MFAVIVNNLLTNESSLFNSTIYDDEDTAREICRIINQQNARHIEAWINDFGGTLANSGVSNTIDGVDAE